MHMFLKFNSLFLIKLIYQIFILQFLKLGLCLSYRPSHIAQTRGYIWPKPQKQQFRIFALEVSSKVSWKVTAGINREVIICPILEKSIERHKKFYVNEINGKYHKAKYPLLKRIAIHVEEGCTNIGYPSQTSKENYNLTVEYPRAIITANEVWGALRGIESLTQLIYPDRYHIRPLINETFISDRPFYQHRGFLIDTSRHYLTMQVIMKHLDAMEMVKLNVLHWHIIDDQSFPFQSKTYPKLSQFGAFNPETHIYTHRDIENVIEEARLRGIRVIPEFDIPAHTRSWVKGHPELYNDCSHKIIDRPQGPILDATSNYTLLFLNNLIKEVSELFQDQILYLGGDEFDTQCWIQPRVAQDKMSEPEKLISRIDNSAEKFFNAIGDIVQKLNIERRTMFWQEVLEMGGTVSENSIINVWKNTIIGKDLLSLNVRRNKAKIVVSNGWYLDHVKYGESWRERYDSSIFRVFPQDRELMEAVIGGESCLWGEFVDSTNFLQQAWPDTAAMAEKLWFGNNISSYQFYTQERLNELRCRLISRGIPAKPIQSSFCYNEWTY